MREKPFTHYVDYDPLPWGRFDYLGALDRLVNMAGEWVLVGVHTTRKPAARLKLAAKTVRQENRELEGETVHQKNGEFTGKTSSQKNPESGGNPVPVEIETFTRKIRPQKSGLQGWEIWARVALSAGMPALPTDNSDNTEEGG